MRCACLFFWFTAKTKINILILNNTGGCDITGYHPGLRCKTINALSISLEVLKGFWVLLPVDGHAFSQLPPFPIKGQYF